MIVGGIVRLLLSRTYPVHTSADFEIVSPCFEDECSLPCFLANADSSAEASLIPCVPPNLSIKTRCNSSISITEIIGQVSPEILCLH